MPATSTPRRRSLRSIDQLPPAFRAGWQRNDAAAQRLWAAYGSDPSIAARNGLAEHYLSFCFAVAVRWNRRLHYRVPLDDLHSDCCYGLLVAIGSADPDRWVEFTGYASAVMGRRVMASLMDGKDWSYHARRSHLKKNRASIIRSFRRRLAREEGRAATKEEITAHLATMIDNPLLQVGEAPPPMLYLSDDAWQCVQPAAPQRPLPELSNTRALRLAMRDLTQEDRRVLVAVLRGESSAAVGKMLGIKRKAARERMTGVLWTLARRRDLAELAGREPVKVAEPRGASRPVPCAVCGTLLHSRWRGLRKFCSDECREAGGWEARDRQRRQERRAASA